MTDLRKQPISGDVSTFFSRTHLQHLLKITAAPLLSLFVFMLGSGLFTTLLTVRLQEADASTFFIGALTSVYYAGLVYGSFRIERYIIMVGHIRAFAAFASFLAALSIMQGIFFNELAWLLLRFLGGIATAGIFVVTESWLLSLGSLKTRGQILALYMVSLYGAQALGQFLLNLGDAKTLLLFALTAMLSALSVIPVALTKIPAPVVHPPSALRFKALFRASASGVLGAFCGGLLLSALYGLLPLVMIQKTGDISAVGLFMALVILGGMCLQYPVGMLSDWVGRRLLLLGLSFLTALLAILIIYFFNHPYLLYLLLFLLGGLTFTLYPVSISHACDALLPSEIVAGTQGMLFCYSVGATLGPLVTPVFIGMLGSNGFFFYIITISVLLGFFVVWRKVNIPSTPQEESFIAIPQTSPVTAELDPRSQPVEETNDAKGE